VSHVRYELGVYIPEDDILHSHRRENSKSYIALTDWALKRRRNVFPVRYELGFYIQEDYILHSHSRGNPKSYMTAGVPAGISLKRRLYSSPLDHKLSYRNHNQTKR
jgi:hypothetical protein